MGESNDIPRPQRRKTIPRPKHVGQRRKVSAKQLLEEPVPIASSGNEDKILPGPSSVDELVGKLGNKNVIKTQIKPPAESHQVVAVPRRKSAPKVHPANKIVASQSMKVSIPKPATVNAAVEQAPNKTKAAVKASPSKQKQQRTKSNARRVGKVRKADGTPVEFQQQQQQEAAESSVAEPEPAVPKVAAAAVEKPRKASAGALKKSSSSTARRVGKVRKADGTAVVQAEQQNEKAPQAEPKKNALASKQTPVPKKVEKFPSLEERYAAKTTTESHELVPEKGGAQAGGGEEEIASTMDIASTISRVAKQSGVQIHVHAPVNIHLHLSDLESLRSKL